MRIFMDINFQKKNGEMISIGSGIAESGDGYIRFSDGTQICYGYISDAYNNTSIPYPKLFSTSPYVMFNYSSIYCTDINMLYLFHINTGGFSINDNDHNSKNTLKLSIEVVTINTKLATADLGGHKHKIEAAMAIFDEGIKSNLDPNLTLKGLYVDYIAIGRWK